jgi:elongation factor P
MDPISFEQFELPKHQIADLANFLKDGEEVDLLYFEGNPINIQLPIKMKFKITYTEPGFKGNTATNVLKPATIETGAEVKVPIFVKEGDEIIIDTRTGAYVERA